MLMELCIRSNLCNCSPEPTDEPTCRTETRALSCLEQLISSNSEMEVLSWLQSTALGTAAVKIMSPAVKSVANATDCLSVYLTSMVRVELDCCLASKHSLVAKRDAAAATS